MDEWQKFVIYCLQMLYNDNVCIISQLFTQECEELKINNFQLLTHKLHNLYTCIMYISNQLEDALQICRQLKNHLLIYFNFFRFPYFQILWIW